MRGVEAKKYLGQHFLIDKKIARSITELLSKDTRCVVEIGPGMGMLTQFLLEKSFDTNVVEIDKESVLYLNLNYPKLKGKIIENDFLALNLKKKYPKIFSLIGNFPYNISSQILFKVFENKNQIREVVGMFQKEVAERIVCKRGKKRGILSVFIQAFYNTEYCLTVNENVFIPKPKVKSAVIKLIRNNRKSLECDERLFKRIVKTGFNQRRKTLRNALKPFTLQFTNELEKLLKLRAEQLSVEDFIKLTIHVKKNSNK